MAYIGQRPVIGRYIKLDQISSGFNGSNTGFSMTAGSQAVFPGTARNLLLSLGGVIQEPDTDFTISGSTLTFTTPPVANTTFFGVIYGDMQATGTPSDGTVLPASIASSGHFKIPQLTVNEDGADVDFRVEGDTEVNLLFVDASADKVGIGTSSPNARLVVYRKTVNASNPVLEVRSDHDTTNSIKFSIDGDGEAFFSDNVGIGTTSPTGLLHLKSSSAETILKIESESADDAMVFIDTSDGTGANADVRFARDGSTKGRISFLNAGSTQGDMRFTTGSDDEAMRIDSSGNVGIGTTSPATILHVKANVGDMLRLDRNNTGSVGNQIAFRHSNSGTFQETGSINCVSTANAGAGQLRFSTRESGGSNTEKMRIEDDGKVGIGTTSPAVRLEVEDTISATFSADNSITAANQLLKLENLGSNSFAGMHFRTAGGGDGHFGTFQNTSSANDCTFYFSNQIDSGGGQLLATLDSQTGDFIVNKGKVGINTDSPQAKLQVNDTNPVVAEFYRSDGGTDDEARIALGALSNNIPSQRGILLTAVNNGAGHNFSIRLSPSHNLGPVERMLIDSAGKQEITQTNGSSTSPVLHLFRPNAASNAAVDMIHFDSGNQGRGKLVSASNDAGSPALASRSDYRIKENIRNYTGGWDNIKAVPVKLFDVTTDGSKDQKGWIAHELQAVLPDLVQGTKDAVDEDGNPIYQSVCMGLFMPDVVNALQTAIAKIETLEAKVAALEAA